MTPDNNRVIHWGTLGAARITAKVAPAIQAADQTELSAIASRSTERAQQWATQYAVPKIYNSYEALLEDPQIDAVYIPLPPSFHHEWTIKAAEHKKHVLCEKPLALNYSQSQEMWHACQQHGVQLMDGVMWHHHPRKQAMLELIHNNTLGELRRVTSAFTFCWPQRPNPENEYRLVREHGGGSLYDLGWYNVGATLLAFGELPQRVWATARHFNDVDMNLSALMWFSNNRMASFDNGFDTVKRQWLEVCGTQKTLVCDDFVLPHPHLNTHRFWLHDGEGKGQAHELPVTNQIVSMINNFCSTIRSGHLNHSWPELSLNVQRVCDAIVASARNEIPVDL